MCTRENIFAYTGVTVRFSTLLCHRKPRYLFTVGAPFESVLCPVSQGAYIGLLAGFAMGLWIGIGAQLYPPPLSTAPVSVAGCLVNTSAPLTSPLKPNATAVLPKR